MTGEGARAFAVLGLFSAPEAILDAARKLRPRRLGRLEAYTPYPVHGLDAAIGLAPSRLGRLVFVMGLTGAALAQGEVVVDRAALVAVADARCLTVIPRGTMVEGACLPGAGRRAIIR